MVGVRLMNKVKQTVLHDPATGKTGNCLSAVLASLLHMPIEEVPVFKDTLVWRKELNAWLRPMNLAYIQVGGFAEWAEELGIEGCYHEVAGPSHRSVDTLHACVGLDGEVIFDPHPDDSGLLEIQSTGVFITLRPWESHNACT
jgi:hypothetical protein